MQIPFNQELASDIVYLSGDFWPSPARLQSELHRIENSLPPYIKANVRIREVEAGDYQIMRRPGIFPSYAAFAKFAFWTLLIGLVLGALLAGAIVEVWQ